MEHNNYIEMIEAIRDHAKVVDLSYTMEMNMPFWPTQPKYEAAVVETYEAGGESYHQSIRISEHTGTHIDAPKHFIPGGCPVDELSPRTVMGRGVTIHGENIAPCGLLPLEQIKAFEAENGEIRAGDIVMIRFGWEDKYAILPEDKGFLRDWPGGLARPVGGSRPVSGEEGRGRRGLRHPGAGRIWREALYLPRDSAGTGDSDHGKSLQPGEAAALLRGVRPSE